jgi:predicted RNA-binding protein with PUA-like domain
MVDIKAEEEFLHHVTLTEIKATPGLENMVLVNRSRLSVQPVKPNEWDIIVTMGKRRDASRELVDP